MRFGQDFLDKLKNKYSVSDVISAYVPIERKGRKYWASCPFHTDKTPSLMIDNERGSFYCFSCKRGGDIFKFIEEKERLTFGEAVEYVAKKAGVELPQEEESQEQRKRRKLFDSAYACLKETAKYYCANLFSGKYPYPIEYLRSRGISDKTMKVFGLGYSTDYESLVRYLREKGFSEETMLFAGVVNRGETGRLTDAEAKRLIVPLIDGRGRVIGFGGRRLDETMHGKYVNTRGTAIFEKRFQLFNMNNFVKLNRQDAILVEGYFDVISLHQAGIENALAAMGTAFTEQHCELFKRYGINAIYVCFDGDSAGQKATVRSLDLLKDNGLTVKVVSIPDDMDPDDAIKKLGKAGFLDLIDNALPLIDYKLSLVEKEFPPEGYSGRSKYIKAATDVLAELNDTAVAEIYLDRIAELSGVKKETLLNTVINRTSPKKQEPKAQTFDKPEPPAEEKKLYPIEQAGIEAARIILASFIDVAAYADPEDLRPEYFVIEEHKTVYKYLTECIEKGIMPKIATVYNLIPEGDEASKMDFCLINMSNTDKKDLYLKSVKKLKNDCIISELKILSEKYSVTEDDQERAEIRNKIKALTIKKNQGV